MKEIYLQYVKYNLWANRHLAELFSTLTDEEAEQHIESSFPSIKRTILHIWDAEVVWLTRLKEGQISDFPSKNFEGDFKEILEGWLSHSAEFLSHVDGMAEEDFSKSFSFKTISAGTYTHRAAEMIHHCMNHSTYHRGQLITFARQLGVEKPPSTDMIFYLRKKEVP